MSRDYANRKPRAGAKARAPQRKKAPKRSFPYFAVFVILTLLSGFGYFLWSINGSSDSPVTSEQVQQPKKKTVQAVAADAPKKVVKKDPNALPPKPQEEWTYLEELENKQVEIDLPQSGVVSSGIYQMQCGSFRQESQANEMKARIAFQGAEAQVRRSEGTNGIWYRVVLGPYPNKREAEHNRHKMQSAGLNGCIIWLWE
ncbi:SPOR domain-containing protein [Shewanella sp. SR43-4]|uniref:SPOR domain-containing protein n=1 Tax=Shewanella vesiculosa TaxID=518738 RepID=A0ABV0FQR1_9GAMM|nr:SPOR domain-containing protein [Shewanella sp. SR43-4]MBB1319664.1 SPOR domain-containing protein [Shewanella sp. SR43-4]